jgi:hypothetical protein
MTAPKLHKSWTRMAIGEEYEHSWTLEVGEFVCCAWKVRDFDAHWSIDIGDIVIDKGLPSCDIEYAKLEAEAALYTLLREGLAKLEDR